MRQAEAISACDKENSTTLSSKEIERYSRCVETLVRSNNSTCEKAALSKDYELSNQERTYKDDYSSSQTPQSKRLMNGWRIMIVEKGGLNSSIIFLPTS